MPDIGLLTDYNARVLDPSTAAVVSGQPPAPHRAVPQALMALSRVVEQSDRP
jgi:hypothetical protein